MSKCVFVYGSLLADEVVAALLGRRPARAPASVAGYARFALKDVSYPSATHTGAGLLSGSLLRGLDDAELSTLDAFEGDEYVSRVVDAELEGGERVSCIVYEWAGGAERQHGEWSYESWRAQHLNTFVASCERWAAAHKDAAGR